MAVRCAQVVTRITMKPTAATTASMCGTRSISVPYMICQLARASDFDMGRIGNANIRRLGNWDHHEHASAVSQSTSQSPALTSLQFARRRPVAWSIRVLPQPLLVPNGFTVQLPSSAARNRLPAGFIATVNAPGGGASRQTRRPNLLPGVSPYLDNDRNFLNPAAFAIPLAGTFGNLPRNALKGPNFQTI